MIVATLLGVWCAQVPTSGPLVPAQHPLIYDAPTPLSEVALRRLASVGAWRPITTSEAGLQLDRCPGELRLSCTARSAQAAPWFFEITRSADRWVLGLLDTKGAIARYEATDRSAPGAEATLEAEIRAQDRVLVTGSPGAPIEEVIEVLLEAARPRLVASGVWAESGTLKIRAPAGLEVRIDGVRVANTGEDGGVVERVAAGAHRVELSDPLGRYSDPGAAVIVAGGAIVEHDPGLTTGAAPMLRGATVLGGVALGLAGASLLTWVALSPTDVEVLSVCPAEQCTKSGAGFRRSSELLEGGDPTAPRGPLVAPLGYSLLGAGLTMVGGTLLIGDEWEVPWLAWLLGAAVGGAAYGLSEAFGG